MEVGESYSEYVLPQVVDNIDELEKLRLTLKEDTVPYFMAFKTVLNSTEVFLFAGQVPYNLDEKYIGVNQIEFVLSDSSNNTISKFLEVEIINPVQETEEEEEKEEVKIIDPAL